VDLADARHGARACLDVAQRVVEPASRRRRAGAHRVVDPPFAMPGNRVVERARVAIGAGQDDASLVVEAVGDLHDVRRRPRTARAARCGGEGGALPGRARPRASTRQFIELAVNIPSTTRRSGTRGFDRVDVRGRTPTRDGSEIAETRLRPCRTVPSEQGSALPPSSGRRRRRPPGCSAAARPSASRGDLSQFEMQMIASAQWPGPCLDRVRDQVAGGQGVQHPAVAHRDPVVAAMV